MFSELNLLLNYFRIKRGTLVDVGVHHGSFTLPFAKLGWRVWAFEPEENNANRFENNLNGFNNVTLIRKAVSNKNIKNVDFYISSKHYGIHSLKPFHKTHTKKVQVETIKLSDFLKKNKISEVDLLKIDIEGADFLALKGFDFKRYKPEIVMVEFMNSRTVKNWKYSYHDMVKYMQKQNYAAYISEWAPIKDYASEDNPKLQHKWLEINKYPLDHNPSWGNIIFVNKVKCKKFSAFLNNYILNLSRNVKIHRKIKYVYSNFSQTIASNNTSKLLFTSKIIYRSLLNINRNLKNSHNDFKLQRFKDKYKNKRCFIIGNGPSLNKIDPTFLGDEYTFGLNRIYLKFSDWGFKTNFLVCINKLVIDQFFRDFRKQNIDTFVRWDSRKYFKDNRKFYFLKSVNGPLFSQDISNGVWEGSTVTYVAMQMAFFMGFQKVILIGVDHNFKAKGTAHRIQTMKKDDVDHFSKDYFKGVKWQLPDLETSELAYRIAKYVFEFNGREIVDATVDGKLKVFKKVKYESLFQSQ